MVALLLWWLITLFLWLLVGRVVISFVPLFAPGWTPRGWKLVVVEGVYTITDPPVNAVRKVFRPVRVGNVAIDVSVMVLFLGLQIVQLGVRFLPV